ncbi:class I SAM-dependent DNA methyltransferase [Streptomyces sp. MspMP-M5]|uniref:class I SAM-dependent DNA methyltransferase n=1 Tax=unclassified Streptomyces TaxID=2593676 RepID=UPI00037B0166|nr:class I SAM-dependent DNA methyltransferase [Streptomyces sp. MspMP-M5]MYT31708.1 N-6 DNA methylase [Streptomyces sp. SID8354]
MNPEARRLVDRLWTYCNVLRDDGVSSLEYLEQLSFLVFLKMAHEVEELNAYISDPSEHQHILPTTPEWQRRGWRELVDVDGEPLEKAYTALLTDLGHRAPEGEETTLSLIFNRARNRIENAANLRRLVSDLINKEKWYGSRTDIKGAAYEALIARSAEDTKAGAGQYFTPRVLIESIVRCMRPTPYDTITDPACGTGGFLLAAYAYILSEYAKDDIPDDVYERLRTGGIWGTEIVPSTARLAAMNMLLHNLGDPTGKPLIKVGDALAKPPSDLASVVLANPPFGRKSSLAITGVGKKDSGDREDIAYHRPDFWLGEQTTTNKQFNFLQHIGTLLTDRGRAAVILPDNVLFEGGKDSAGAQIRRELLTNYRLHTMLRLPAGIFYAGGVKANVLFFDAVPDHREESDSPRTDRLWIYDLRTGNRFTLKQNPLRPEHLADFEKRAFSPEDPDHSHREESERFRVYETGPLLSDPAVNLDIGLIDPATSDSVSIPELTASVASDLRAALSEIEAFAEELGVDLTMAPED